MSDFMKLFEDFKYVSFVVNPIESSLIRAENEHLSNKYNDTWLR